MLHFGAPSPLSGKRFMQLCQDWIPQEDIKILNSAFLDKEYAYKGEQPTLKKWHAFERSLRNELAKIRAAKMHQDFHRHIRLPDDAEVFISRIALNASRIPSLIEAERILDEARWQFLDELCLGHFFDIDYLIVYSYKLLILERWDRIRAADKLRLLKDALAKGDN
jgi:hypothetical protein